MAQVLSLSDLNTTINHEPRIADDLLANKLGYERPRAIRQIIERNKAEIETYGSLATQRGKSRGQEFMAYFLNEGQSLVVCALSRTSKAAEIRKAIIEVFMAWRRGKIVETKTAHQELIIRASSCFSNSAEAHGAVESLISKIKCGIQPTESEYALVQRWVFKSMQSGDALARLLKIGSIPSLDSKQLALPYPRKPINAKAIHDSVEELYCVIGHFKMLTQQGSMTKSTVKIHNLLLDAAKSAASSITKEVIQHC